MAGRTYFAADVHLGLDAGDPAEREERFVGWLKGICKPGTEAVYLLGDIWDFWYEYRDVIPREGVRVVAQIVNLLDAGIKVFYFSGNHDIWMYSFWQKLGVTVLRQPQLVSIGGKEFLLGHGDGLGGASRGYSLMLKVFHNRVCQRLFSTLHPWLAFRFGTDWSNSNRRSHGGYRFRGVEEPLYRFCVQECTRLASEGTPVDFCIFGHFHDAVDMPVEYPGRERGSRLLVLKDWIGGGVHYACWDGVFLEVM